MDHCEIPRWQLLKQSLNNLGYKAFMEAYAQDPDGVLIDARTPQEFAVDHFPEAINLNYLSHHLADDLEALDPDKSYYVYCRTSRRSLRICVLLRNMGFQRVYHLEEGVSEVG